MKYKILATENINYTLVFYVSTYVQFSSRQPKW